MQNQLPKTFFSFIWHFLRGYKPAVVSFVLLSIAAGFWGPFNSMLVKHLINMLPQVHDGDITILVLPASLIILNFIVFDNFTWRGVGYIKYKYMELTINRVIKETLDYTLLQSHQFFQDNLSGSVASYITKLANSIEEILYRFASDLIRGMSLLVAAFIASFFANPTFFYILIIWFICFASFSILLSRRFVPMEALHAENEALVVGQVVDIITNNNTVNIFARKVFELLRMDRFFTQALKSSQRIEMYIVILNSIQGAMIAIMMGFTVYFLIHFYSLGLVSIGDFALMLGLSMELGHMMWFTMARIDDFNKAYGRCKQSLSVLMQPPEILNKPNATVLRCTQGQITFDTVTFHYKGTTPLFSSKSVTIEPGQKVGLVGYSGGGKSTFVNLILRLYDVTGGAILIDGQDIRDVTQDSLRANIAMIPQDPSLFHRSLIENIRYGRIDATDAEVMDAAQKAHAHEFITKLPQGYDSLVGERGVKLSGGQRQRIAIARAILKNAPILILDEATSQLDSVTEILIQKSLWELMHGKTTIVIAHRLSTLLHMDRILVFEKGKIIEDGSHSALLTKNGLYKQLWDAQVGGFLGDDG